MIKELFPLDEKVVLFGMSCVGKTTFAQALAAHHYYCFDSMFHWWEIENFNLSVETNLQEVAANCTANRYVLDGWTLADVEGFYLPPSARVFVIYAPYQRIISQYRIPVYNPEEFRLMFNKWYSVNYNSFVARYFRNEGVFIETSEEEFQEFFKKEIKL